MRKTLLLGVLTAFFVCGLVAPGTASAKEQSLRPMQENSDTEGRWGRRSYRRGGRGRHYRPRYYAPRYYQYYAPPPPAIYGAPCYSVGNGVIVCPGR